MLLLLHGAMGYSGDFEAIKNHLPKELECQTIDFPGHGGRHGNDFGDEAFMQAILDFMTGRELNKIDIFGYSMGGYVAIQFAIKHPDKVGSIMSLNTIWNWNEAITQKMVGSLDPVRIKTKVPAFAEQLERIHKPNSWEKLAEKTANYLRELELNNGIDKSAIEKLQNPVIIVRGEFDPIVSIESSKLMADSMQHGCYDEVKEGKHSLDQIDPKELADGMVQFFLKD